jgi:hypothetical protein
MGWEMHSDGMATGIMEEYLTIADAEPRLKIKPKTIKNKMAGYPERRF